MRNFFAKWNRPWVRTTFKVTWITLKWTIISAFLAGIVGGSAAFGYVSALVKKDPVRSRRIHTPADAGKCSHRLCLLQ